MGTQGEAAQTKPGEPQVRNDALSPLTHSLNYLFIRYYRFLIFFLNELSKHENETKMGVNNIAIVIGPNLLWPDEPVAKLV